MRIANLKHYWFRCKACGTMHRENKEHYPADLLIKLSSHSWVTRAIANRLFPKFLRRVNFEEQVYASYGDLFHKVLNWKATGNRLLEFWAT